MTNQLNSDQKNELIESYVELIVDSMSTKDLVAYVSEWDINDIKLINTQEDN